MTASAVTPETKSSHQYTVHRIYSTVAPLQFDKKTITLMMMMIYNRDAQLGLNDVEIITQTF